MSLSQSELSERSRAVRSVRGAIKRELRACPDKHSALRLCAQHIADPVAELATLSAYDLIAAGYRCGPTVAFAALAKAKVSAIATIGQPDDSGPRGSLTDAQRARLVDVLQEGPPPRVQYRGKPAPPAVTVVAPDPEPEPAPTPVAAATAPEPALRLAPAPATPGPSLSQWCPRCAEWAIPMIDGTCGFCDTQIVSAA